MSADISIILPAHNEAAYIGKCLAALLASDPVGARTEIIVVANGCGDDTATIARGFAGAAAARYWGLQVIEVAEGGKLNALNRGDAAASGDVRIYLDADVIPDPPLIAELADALHTQAPRYASGRPRVAPATNFFTRAYGRFWSGLPFVQGGVPGFGIFAVNAAGRARWGTFPDIISDDTYVRLQFSPAERVGVKAGYGWPMVEGFANLVRVRRRQNAGVAEIAEKFPELMQNDDKSGVSASGLIARFARDPIGFCIYGAVALAVRTPLWRSGNRWARGR